MINVNRKEVSQSFVLKKKKILRLGNGRRVTTSKGLLQSLMLPLFYQKN